MLNKNTKMFLLLTLIFFTAVGLSAVSATEIDADASDIPVATQEIAADSSDISVDTAQSDLSNKNTQLNKKTVENVKSEGEGNFTELVTDISESEVTLTKDYIQAEGETAIEITQDKTVDGNGHMINTSYGAFTVASGVTFTLKNSIILSPTYGPDYNHYVDVISNRGNLVLDNVTFQYGNLNQVKTYGEPIYSYGDSSITATDCRFEFGYTNRAAIYAYGPRVKLDIDNCVFDRFHANNGVIYMSATGSNLTVKNTNFTNNGGDETNQAAVIYANNANQVIYIENCIFENNTGQRRGMIYDCGNITIKDSTFKNNEELASTYTAGVLWVDRNNAVVTLENNIMEENVAKAADIYFNNGKLGSKLVISGENVQADQEAPVEVTLDVTDDNGNGIDFRLNPFTMKINGETIPIKYENGTIKATFDASYDPGEYDITIEYDNTNIIGDVELPEITLTVNDIGLLKYATVQNAIDSVGMGKTVVIEGPVFRGSSENSIVVDKYVNIDFNGNTINAKEGKVFDFKEGSVSTIKNAIITNVGNSNPTIYNTEGRIANITGGIVTFENVTFVDNVAPNLGSSAYGSFIAVIFNDSYVKLTDCTIENCKGTFINLADGTASVEKTTFKNNIYSSADALIANGGDLEVIDSEFINNTVNLATIRGQSNTLPYSAYGAYYTFYNRPLTITGTTFENNYAGNGRGAAVNTHNDTRIVDSVFINNRINQYSNKGGAVFSEEDTLTIDNCVFINNSARYSVSSWSGTTANNGTAIYNAEGDMYITNSIIVSNVTEASAVYNDAEDANVVANGNYWGQIDPTGRYGSGAGASEITVDNWVILGITATPSENINYQDNVTITVGLTKVTDGETENVIENPLPDYGYVEFEANGGDLEYAIVDVADGSASDKVTVTYNPAEIIATYMNDAVGITLDVTMPEPMDITLNDGNWTTYFDETTGTIKSDLIVPDSILRFDGVFTERDMVIDMPVTITTADNQAILNNCTITVKSDNVNIKDIQMNSEDYSDVLIEVSDASNVVIENNKLTITNNEIDQVTRAIRVNGGEDNVIQGNEIHTYGPENDIVYYDSGAVKVLYTASIEAVCSDGLIITGNKIHTEITGDATDLGTIYGVYVTGEDFDSFIYDVEITDNYIATAGEVYEYGITVNNAGDVIISDNNISTVSEQYADGIQAYYILDSVIENNNIEATSESLTYGILINGFYDWDEYEGYESKGDTIRNNTIILSSDNAWGIELYYGTQHIITENDITIDCDYGVGVGIADASYNNVTDNTIAVTAAMEGEPDTMDMVNPIPAGVKVQTSSMQMHAATYNEIRNNHIIVDAPVATVPAVNVTQRSTITENYLVSPKGVGNAAVVNTAYYGTTIRDNTPLVYVITNDTYYDFFGEDYVFINDAVENGSYLNISGAISEKNYFIFDNVELVIVNDGTGILYNATIITENGAKVSFDGLVIDNVDQEAVYFESEGNELKNSEITVESEYELFPVQIAADNNYISNVKIYATVPSADVKYGPAPDYKTEVPAPAALLITSSNNIVEDAVIVMDGSATVTGAWAPTTDGIYILSLDETISNNKISDSVITVVGPNYVYGINVGNAKDTELDNVSVFVMSDYYADAVQLFDADTIAITGNLTAYAGTQAYGVYSTAMGSGISQNIVVVDSNIKVAAPDATGILIEGANNTGISETTFDIEGANASAVMAHIDWMDNIPNGIDISRCIMNITTDGERNVLYFGKCADVSVVLNTIKSTGGSKIFFNSTTGGVVTGNYIMINDVIIGNHAVDTTEDDTIIEDNTPVNEEYEAMLELLKMYQTSIITIDDIDPVVYHDEVTITGKLNDGMGNLIPDQTLTITIGDLIDTVTTENGLFEYSIIAKQIGENLVTVTYEGTENHNAAEANTTFIVDKKQSEVSINDIATVTCNDNVTISGMITDIDGNPLGHVNVFVYLNGEEQHVTTYRTGIFKATFTTSTVGEQEVLVVYRGNDKYLKSNATATFTVTGTKLVMYTVKPVTYRDNFTVQGKLTDAEGNIIAGAEVQLTINGETVTLTTDKNGKYTYKAQALALGEFTVTASYVDEATGTELTVTKTLEVTKRAVTLVVDEISDVAVGEEVTITGKLTDDIDTPYKNCNIYVDINGEQQHIKTDTKGIFTCTYTPVSAGTHDVTITYKGNANYLGDKVTTTFEATA